MITKEKVDVAWREYYDFQESNFGGPGNGCGDYRDLPDEVFARLRQLEKVAKELQAQYNKENYVDNDVWKYRVSLKYGLEDTNVVVYTKPLPEPIFITEKDFEKECKRQEDFVQNRYFTKEKIEELKQEFIKRIQECENPFNICCVDKDGGYNVTEEELFNID